MEKYKSNCVNVNLFDRSKIFLHAIIINKHYWNWIPKMLQHLELLNIRRLTEDFIKSAFLIRQDSHWLGLIPSGILEGKGNGCYVSFECLINASLTNLGSMVLSHFLQLQIFYINCDFSTKCFISNTKYS